LNACFYFGEPIFVSAVAIARASTRPAKDKRLLQKDIRDIREDYTCTYGNLTEWQYLRANMITSIVPEKRPI
jgi:hypothetical protein